MGLGGVLLLHQRLAGARQESGERFIFKKREPTSTICSLFRQGNITLTVKHPPRVTSVLGPVVRQARGHRAVVTCRVESTPVPLVRIKLKQKKRITDDMFLSIVSPRRSPGTRSTLPPRLQARTRPAPPSPPPRPRAAGATSARAATASTSRYTTTATGWSPPRSRSRRWGRGTTGRTGGERRPQKGAVQNIGQVANARNRRKYCKFGKESPLLLFWLFFGFTQGKKFLKFPVPPRFAKYAGPKYLFFFFFRCEAKNPEGTSSAEVRLEESSHPVDFEELLRAAREGGPPPSAGGIRQTPSGLLLAMLTLAGYGIRQ